MSGSLVFFTFIIIVFAGVVKLFIPLNPSKTGKNPENIFLDTKSTFCYLELIDYNLCS